MSNTSKRRAEKGSKFWMQTLVNLDNGNALTKEIQKVDSSVGDITWISPLEKDEYAEYKLNTNSPTMSEEIGIEKKDIDFWPIRQPQWDAIGIVEDSHNEKKTIILVEAKSYLNEMKKPCTAKDDGSKKLIKQTLKETCENLSKGNSFDEKMWMKTYYQLGNRLAFLDKLKEKGYNVKLVFLNIVNDITHSKDKQISEQLWKNHYENVFKEMLGDSKTPDNVIILNVEILMKWS